ncbi:MAG: biopolymer transporter ExbD [Planctomycetes bacterium]|nr:biopolymer transporter ExbD [Planctomycetota bacterium]
MPIRFQCNHCSRTLTADENRVGMKFTCPSCGSDSEVPRPQEQQAPAAGPPPVEPGEEVEPVKFGAKRAEDEGIDMTPMVDVTFLLLIFFMVTAAFSLQKSIEIPAPDQEESSTQARTIEDLENDDDYIIIRIAKDNTVWVNEQEAPSEQEVLVRLREAREGKAGTTTEGPTSLLVLADQDARHETVVMCLDAGGREMEDVRLACVDEENL